MQTQLEVGSLRQAIPHLREITEDGWVMSWQTPSAEGLPFEIVCKGASTTQIQALDASLTKAYEAATRSFGE